MPTFRDKATGVIVQAVKLRKPLSSERGLPVKDIEKTAWAGDWFVVGPVNQGWMAEPEFLEQHQPVMQDPVPGMAVFDPGDGEFMGDVELVSFDPNKGEMVVTFTRKWVQQS